MPMMGWADRVSAWHEFRQVCSLQKISLWAAVYNSRKSVPASRQFEDV